MKIATEHEHDTRSCVVRLGGEIDAGNVGDVRHALENALNRGCMNVVLDLSRVTYADSSALGLIVWADRLLVPKGGRLVLAGASRHVGRILELSGLVGAAPTVSASPDVDDALAGLELPTLPAEPLWTRSFEVVADATALADIRNTVCETLEPLGMGESALFDVRVAVGEALSNAVRHGSSGSGDEMVGICVTAHPDRVVIEVSDSGTGFDGQSLAGADPYAASGRGVLFMRALMDRVEFSATSSGGTAVTLVKHLEGQDT
jgi:anti-anti-sigma factor